MPDLSSRGIFLSYRREDAAPYARLLYSQLRERIPDARVFMDLDSIEAGLDFAEVIREAVESCVVLVALIGRQWATLADEEGRLRLDNPDDYVRFEIQTALERGTRVIPVLVDGARPLRRQQLPSELRKLERLNALELSYSRYEYDADRLVNLIQRVLAAASGTDTGQQSPPAAKAEAPAVPHDRRPDRTVQHAHNDLAEARGELEREFGRYKEVRDLASGIIYMVKSGYISRAVILDVTERLAIRTPRYWLAPAILAVAAWLDGDKDRYVESIKTALALDHSKTALFMTILLRNQARNEDMREWIGSYLAGLEPANLPTDFAVIVEAVAGRTLGVDSTPQLVRRMRGWYENAASSRVAEDEEIGQWERNLMGLARAGDYAEAFPILARSSPEWELLRKRHEAGSAIEAADQYFRGRFGEGAEVSADLDEKIGLLLKSLAEDPDPAEDRILQRIRYAEAVIETQDQAAAERRVAAEEADRSRALNILSLVTRAAFPAGRRRPPSMTELLAIVMSQRFISAAAERIHGRHQRPARVKINLGQRQCSFSCSTDDETTPEALRQQANDLAGQLAGQIDDQATKQRDKLRRQGRRRVIVWLQMRMGTVADNGSREKSEITSTLIRASEELATLFSQEQRSRDLLPGLQAYLLGLTADDAHRAIRFTARPPHTLMLPGPADRDTPDDADPAETRDDGVAHGFPKWTPWPPTRARPLPGRMTPPV